MFSPLALLRAVFCLSAIVAPAPFCCPAQPLQGTIDGNITDPSGAAIAGATVRVTNQATAVGRGATTNSLGEYTLPTLPPGTYDSTASASGFTSTPSPGLSVTCTNPLWM